MGDVKILMVADFIACDGRVIRVLRSKQRRSFRMAMCFIVVFLTSLASFSTYVNLLDEDEYSRDKRLGRTKTSTMVVSIMHVDYGILNTAAESILLLPRGSGDSIAMALEGCCGKMITRGNTTTAAEPLVVDGTKIDVVSSAEDNVLDDCEPTTQVRVIFSHPFWSIQALDERGNDKKLGGDEFFVVYLSRATGSRLVAKSLDQSDGTYDLDFIEPPLPETSVPTTSEGGTTLSVHLLYTCGMGRYGPPLKAKWKTNGALMRHYEFDDLNNKTVTGKSVRISVPSIVRRPWWAQDGTPTVRERRLLVNIQHDSDNFLKGDHVVFFGDDNLLAMGRAVDSFIPKVGGRHPLTFVGNHSVQISLANLRGVSLKLGELHGGVLRYPDERAKVLMVIGFNSFEHVDENHHNLAMSKTMVEIDNFLPLSWEQVDYLMSCDALIRMIREEYPSVKVYWRLPLPIPFHRFPLACHRLTVNELSDSSCPGSSLQYVSYYRMQQMYQAQKQLMEELDVPVLDLFDGYYASPEHYDVEQGRYSQRLHERLVRHLLETYS